MWKTKTHCLKSSAFKPTVLHLWCETSWRQCNLEVNVLKIYILITYTKFSVSFNFFNVIGCFKGCMKKSRLLLTTWIKSFLCIQIKTISFHISLAKPWEMAPSEHQIHVLFQLLSLLDLCMTSFCRTKNKTFSSTPQSQKSEAPAIATYWYPYSIS